MQPQLYIVGDVHLTGAEGAFHAFLDRLAARGPARLVILGDLFEYWLDSEASERRYGGCLRRLRRLAAAGWRLDLVVGNREMSSGRRLATATRCQVHWPALDLVLGPRRLRVVHGDRLCRDPGYHLLFAVLSGFWLRACKACLPPLVQERIARWMRRRSRLAQLRRRRHRRPQGARLEMLDPARIRGSARGAETVVAGHIHQQWRREIAGVDLILVGDWSRSDGRWVEGQADGRLVLRHADFDFPSKE